jgi:hypothetical protein
MQMYKKNIYNKKYIKKISNILEKILNYSFRAAMY